MPLRQLEIAPNRESALNTTLIRHLTCCVPLKFVGFRPVTIQSAPLEGTDLCEACQTLILEAQVVLTDPDNINAVVSLAESQLCLKLVDPQLVSKVKQFRLPTQKVAGLQGCRFLVASHWLPSHRFKYSAVLKTLWNCVRVSLPCPLLLIQCPSAFE